MIIFFEKTSGKIVGTISGRLHSAHEINNTWVGDKETTNKFIVPYVPKEEGSSDYTPDVPFAELINEFESGVKDPHKHKVVLENDLVKGIIPN